MQHLIRSFPGNITLVNHQDSRVYDIRQSSNEKVERKAKYANESSRGGLRGIRQLNTLSDRTKGKNPEGAEIPLAEVDLIVMSAQIQNFFFKRTVRVVNCVRVGFRSRSMTML